MRMQRSGERGGEANPGATREAVWIKGRATLPPARGGGGAAERRPTLRSIARGVLALVAVTLAASGCEVPSAVIEQGAPVPAFQAPELDGSSVSLASLRGDVVLLNVWATWCYPCRREMPSFEALHQEFGDEGLRVVAVSIDSPGARRDIEEFLTEYGITFTVLHDTDKRITTSFRTLGVPETFLIDREGRLVKRWTGRIDGHSESVRGPIRTALRG